MHTYLCMFSMFPGTSDGGHSSGRFGERRGFRFDGGSGGGGRLPAGGQQHAEVVPVGHGRQPFEDVGEIGFRIVAVAAGAFHQGVNDGGALAGFEPERPEKPSSFCRSMPL